MIENDLPGLKQDDISLILQKVEKIDYVYLEKLTFILRAQISHLSDIRRGLQIIQNLDSNNFTKQAIHYYQKRGPLAQILDLLRNVVFFLPILITWLGLSFAMNAYSKYLEKVQDTIIPFLTLWETGFDNLLPSYFRFSNIALIDAVVIAVLIIMTFVVSIRNTVIDELAYQKAMSLQKDIDYLLWHVESELYTKYSIAVIEEGNYESLVLHVQELISRIQGQTDSVINYLAAEQDRLVTYSEKQSSLIFELSQTVLSFNQLLSSNVDLIRKIDSYLDDNDARSIAIIQGINDIINQLDIISNYTNMINSSSDSLQIGISEIVQSQFGILDEVGESSIRLSTEVYNLKDEYSHWKDEIINLDLPLQNEKLASAIKNYEQIVASIIHQSNNGNTYLNEICKTLQKMEKKQNNNNLPAHQQKTNIGEIITESQYSVDIGNHEIIKSEESMNDRVHNEFVLHNERESDQSLSNGNGERSTQTIFNIIKSIIKKSF